MFGGCRVFSWDNEKRLDMGGGAGCTLSVSLISTLFYIKKVQMVNFLLCIFYHSKKTKFYFKKKNTPPSSNKKHLVGAHSLISCILQVFNK